MLLEIFNQGTQNFLIGILGSTTFGLIIVGLINYRKTKAERLKIVAETDSTIGTIWKGLADEYKSQADYLREEMKLVKLELNEIRTSERLFLQNSVKLLEENDELRKKLDFLNQENDMLKKRQDKLEQILKDNNITIIE